MAEFFQLQHHYSAPLKIPLHMEATPSPHLLLCGHISEPAEHHTLAEQSCFALIKWLLSLFNDFETHSCNCTHSHGGSIYTPQSWSGTVTEGMAESYT